jgi:hypothetical protein
MGCAVLFAAFIPLVLLLGGCTTGDSEPQGICEKLPSPTPTASNEKRTITQVTDSTKANMTQYNIGTKWSENMVKISKGKVDHKHTEGFKNSTLVVYMPKTDEELYDCYLRRTTRYFEWGTGGSTEFAAGHPNLELIVSVDSYQAWIATVGEIPIVKEGIASGRIGMFHVDIGPVKKLGFPTGGDHSLYPKYRKAIVGLTERFDLILVDGRFRVACFLEAIRHYVLQKWQTPTILFHDYMNRLKKNAGKKKMEAKWYSPEILEKYAEKIESAETLAVFKIRSTTYDDPKLLADLDADILKVANRPQ